MGEQKRDYEADPDFREPLTKEDAIGYLEHYGAHTAYAATLKAILENELQKELLKNQNDFQRAQLEKTAGLAREAKRTATWTQAIAVGTWFMALATWILVLITV